MGLTTVLAGYPVVWVSRPRGGDLFLAAGGRSIRPRGPQPPGRVERSACPECLQDSSPQEPGPGHADRKGVTVLNAGRRHCAA